MYAAPLSNTTANADTSPAKESFPWIRSFAAAAEQVSDEQGVREAGNKILLN